jgi:glycosyltransferase involved in cell wall biosynthesis
MKVSILILTYNHEKFIAKAVDSVRMQRVTFDYEIVIGEDCSTDNTRDIVIDYKNKYPDKICLLLRETNLGGRRNFIDALKSCKGKYIALLEGDDYWISPHKLQKQVDFLDSHPECAICFHNVMVIYDNNPEISHPFYVQNPNGPFTQAKPKPISTLEDLVRGNFIQTPSVMFRAPLFEGFPDWYYTLPLGDWPLHILNAEHGNIKYINEIMGVYRVHSGGIFSSKGPIQRLQGEIEMYRFIDAYFNFRYNKSIKPAVASCYLKMAERYKRNGDRINGLKNLFKCIKKFPSKRRISHRRLFFLLLELTLPSFYKMLKGFKHKYLN